MDIIPFLTNQESDWKSYVEWPTARWKNIWNTFITVFAVVTSGLNPDAISSSKPKLRSLISEALWAKHHFYLHIFLQEILFKWI